MAREYIFVVMSASSPSPSAPPDSRAPSWGRLLAALLGRAIVNPRLALDLLKMAWAFRRLRWWSQAPFLPLPDPAYLRWRMYTAYGDEGAVPPAVDVIRFARWRRETMRL